MRFFVIGAIHRCSEGPSLSTEAWNKINKIGRTGVIAWNDNKRRTAEEVIALLRKVAAS